MKNINNKILAMLVTIFSAAFVAVVNTDPTPEAITGLIVAGAFLVVNYGIEDALAILRGKVKPSLESIYYSKRFWSYVTLAVSTFSMSILNINFTFELAGQTVNLYEGATLVFIAVTTGIGLEDLAEAFQRLLDPVTPAPETPEALKAGERFVRWLQEAEKKHEPAFNKDNFAAAGVNAEEAFSAAGLSTEESLELVKKLE